MEGSYEKHAMVSVRSFIMLIVCYKQYLASKMYLLLVYPNNKLVELFLGIEIAVAIDILMGEKKFLLLQNARKRCNGTCDEAQCWEEGEGVIICQSSINCSHSFLFQPRIVKNFCL